MLKLLQLSFPNKCIGCGLIVMQSQICEICEKLLPWNHDNSDIFFSLFKYEDPIRTLIYRLKFGGQLFPAKIFADYFYENIKNRSLPEAIIPVPLHKSRLRSRGYNQSEEISKPLAKKLGIPLLTRCCQRQIFTKPQAKKEFSQRKKMSNVFQVIDSSIPQSIAIFDDIVTTGATVRELSKVLYAAGVMDIQIWCVAHG